ncbi:MAG: hypothetical protein ACOC33_00950 [bacterium]
MKYVKDSPRLKVQYVNTDTDDIIFEVNNRYWMDVGELLSDHYVSEVLKQNVNGDLPENLMVLVVGEYSLKQ